MKRKNLIANKQNKKLCPWQEIKSKSIQSLVISFRIMNFIKTSCDLIFEIRRLTETDIALFYMAGRLVFRSLRLIDAGFESQSRQTYS